MARSTYGTRLEALIANPAISQRDKAFAESLHQRFEQIQEQIASLHAAVLPAASSVEPKRVSLPRATPPLPGGPLRPPRTTIN